MKTDIKKMDLLAAKWWNPLFWLALLFGPVFGILSGIVYGALCGMLIGYEKGLDTSSEKLHVIIKKLP